jgi:hypothetical protein
LPVVQVLAVVSLRWFDSIEIIDDFADRQFFHRNKL